MGTKLIQGFAKAHCVPHLLVSGIVSVEGEKELGEEVHIKGDGIENGCLIIQ